MVDLLPLARPAAVDILSFSFRPDLPNNFVSGITSTVSTGRRCWHCHRLQGALLRESSCLFILFALFIPVDIVDSLLKGVPHFLALGPAYFISGVLYFTGLMTAAITRNERYHEFYAVFFFLQTAVISF